MTITIQNQNIAARYWYDGQFLNNAKEDAAEVACVKMRSPSIVEPRSYGVDIGFVEAREEEKLEPQEEQLPEGAVYRVGDEQGDILD